MKKITIDFKNSDFKQTDKTNPLDFNAEELRGWIIDEMARIEVKIDCIITDFFNPEKKSEFKTIILNSSIINTGSKMKILKNLKTFEASIIDKIQRITSIRNAFAHLPIQAGAYLKVDNTSLPVKIIGEPEIISHLDIMNSSGLIKQRNVKELVNEFQDYKNQIIEYLDSYKPNR